MGEIETYIKTALLFCQVFFLQHSPCSTVHWLHCGQESTCCTEILPKRYLIIRFTTGMTERSLAFDWYTLLMFIHVVNIFHVTNCIEVICNHFNPPGNYTYHGHPWSIVRSHILGNLDLNSFQHPANDVCMSRGQDYLDDPKLVLHLEEEHWHLRGRFPCDCCDAVFCSEECFMAAGWLDGNRWCKGSDGFTIQKSLIWHISSALAAVGITCVKQSLIVRNGSGIDFF